MLSLCFTHSTPS